MSGVIDAFLRSSPGSPAWTARGSECGIASAYPKPLEPAKLLGIVELLQDLQSSLHLRVIAVEQRPLASCARRIRGGAGTVEEADGALQVRGVSIKSRECAFGLRLDQSE